jgi:hypothetical protein
MFFLGAMTGIPAELFLLEYWQCFLFVLLMETENS